jgi:hypothetical protein
LTASLPLGTLSPALPALDLAVPNPLVDVLELCPWKSKGTPTQPERNAFYAVFGLISAIKEKPAQRYQK